MCNPLYFDDDLISNCIKPSYEQDNDKTLELSCERYPLTHVTYPFKNIFCYLCNRNASLTSTFAEGNITINHCIPTGNLPYEYKISIDKLDVDYFEEYIDVLTTKLGMSSDHQENPRDMYASYEFAHNTNLTHAFNKIRAFQNAKFCHRIWNPYILTNNTFYNCKGQYLQCMKKCCFDFEFVYPASCYRLERPYGTFPVSPLNILMVDGCYGAISLEGVAIFKHLCESRHLLESLFGNFPVMYNGFTTTYLNTYCALCNEKRDQFTVKDSIHSLLFYDLRLWCPNYITFHYHTSLFSIIEVARKMRCDENFFPPIENVDICYFDSPSVSICNVTGNWADLRSGCGTWMSGLRVSSFPSTEG